MTFKEALLDLKKSIQQYHSLQKTNNNPIHKAKLEKLVALAPLLNQAYVEAENFKDNVITVDKTITGVVKTIDAIDDIVHDNKVKDGVDVSVTKDSQGDLAIKGEKKLGKGLKGNITISENELSAELKKSWTLFECKSRPIPIFGLIQGKVGVSLKTTLAAKETFSYAESYIEASVKGSFTGEGHADLFLNLLVLETGVTAELEAITTYGGSVRRYLSGGDSLLTIDSLKGDLSFNMDVFIRAGDIVMEIYKGIGGSASTLTWRHEFLSCELFSFEVPGFQLGKATGDIEFGEGKDVKGTDEKLEEGQSWVGDMIAVVMWAQEVWEDMPQFVKDLSGVMWDLATMDMVGMTEGLYNMINQTAAKDETYKLACQEAIKAAIANEEVMEKLKDMSPDERYTFIQANVSMVPLVQEIWKELYENSDFEAAEDTLDQIAAKISDFSIKVYDSEITQGEEVDMAIQVKSDRGFSVGNLTVGLLCDGVLVKGTEQRYSGAIEQDLWKKKFNLRVPEDAKITAKGAKWEISAHLDLKGIIKDQKTKRSIIVHPKKNGPKTKEDILHDEQVKSGKGGGILWLDSHEYDIGGANPDTMDVRLAIWNIHVLLKMSKPEIVERDVYTKVLCNGKVVTHQLQKAVKINLQKATLNFYDMAMPGCKDTERHHYPTTAEGGKWEVVAGISVNDFEFQVASKSIKVTHV